ncbi:MAG: (d)CMP kinase [Candidatus Nucleicultricaceae bacterium]
MSNTPFIIAIDGTAGVGKGTLAKRLAAHFNLVHLDTGALYRALAAKAVDSGVSLNDVETLVYLASDLSTTDFEHPHLRTQEMGEMASKISAHGPVRQALFDYQRDFALNPPPWSNGAVLDGRDIGTVIVPETPYKIFLTASPEIRAQRRLDQLGDSFKSYDEVLQEIRERDIRDQMRTVAPLKPACDAYILDTSNLSEDEVLECAITYVRKTSHKVDDSSSVG